LKKTIVDRRRKAALLAKQSRHVIEEPPAPVVEPEAPVAPPREPIIAPLVNRASEIASRAQAALETQWTGIRQTDVRVLARSFAPWPIAFVASALWILFGPFVAYAQHESLDAWFYPGYFTNFAFLLERGGFTYYVSRLSWIVPGLVAFRIAPPLIANLLLISAVMGTAVASLYWMVRCHYGRTAGILAAAILAANPYFASSTVWTYPDGASIAYGMTALAFFLRPFGNRAVNLILGGAALMLCALTNMASAPVVLGVAAVPLVQAHASMGGRARTACLVGVGFVAMAAVMMAVSRALTGFWQPLLPQILISIDSIRHPEVLRALWGDFPFVAAATRLLLPELVLVLGGVLLVMRRPKADWVAPLYTACAISLGIYAYQQFAQHSIVLRIACHSSYMLVPVMGFAGMAVAELLPHARNRSRLVAISATALALALPILTAGRLPSIAQSTVWIFLVSLCAIGVLLVILGVRHVACFVLVVCIFIGPALDSALAWAWSRQGPIHGPSITAGPNADSYPWLMQLQDQIRPHQRADASVHFWWEDDEAAEMFDAAAAMYLDRRVVLAQAFTDPSDEPLRQRLEQQTLLACLTTRPERLAARLAILAARGYDASNERRSVLPYRGKNIYLVLFDLRARAR